MNATKIEYCDYTWNFVTGCLHGCVYCYARRISQRFNRSFSPKFHPERLKEPLEVKKPSIIFAVSMGDLFGDWVPMEWIEHGLRVIRMAHWHNFILLTKNPKRLVEFNYPPNVWLGITVDTQGRGEGLKYLLQTDAKVKFISFEPLLERINIDLHGVDWIIIGAQTCPEKQPEKEWVDLLIEQADKLGVPVFLKNNLRYSIKRCEMPAQYRSPLR
ncbi:MAG: DUF5131 family protein [Thermofilaceae archaeon]